MSKLTFLLLLALSQILTAVEAADDYERPPTFKASDILEPAMLTSDHHQVNEEVASDGYLNIYHITSDYGDFTAHGSLQLREREKEIGALAELEEVSKTEAFAAAAIDAGLSPVVSLATQPVKTITGIPGGIGRMFKRGSRTASDVVSDDEEPAAVSECGSIEGETQREACEEQEAHVARGRELNERYYKTSDAERHWHQELGTDPYTSNDVLYGAIKSVAWADRLGRFSVKFVGVPSIPGVGYLGTVEELVWSKDPHELREYNDEILAAAGMDEEIRTKFFEHPWMSPTLQTILIAAMSQLEDVPGRGVVLEDAMATHNEAEARFVALTAVMVSWFHRTQSPIERFLPEFIFPIGATKDGRLVVLLPVDYLSWTEELATLAVDAAERNIEIPAERRELWLLGGISPRGRTEINALGWNVYDEVRSLIRESGGVTDLSIESTAESTEASDETEEPEDSD